jgi:hypothetical protein
MAFTKQVCWQPERIYQVLNPDAEKIEDPIFLATLSEYDLALVETRPDAGTERRIRERIRPAEFLDRFLAREREQVQVAVLGSAGSGKSHFIHWLEVKLRVVERVRRGDLLVLSIPKTSITLRGVVERIIGALPQERQRSYREKLDQTGNLALSRPLMRERLIAEIAEAVRSDPTRDGAGEKEQWLIDELPLVFTDPFLRSKLNRERGIIDELLDHIEKLPEGYERREARHSFRESDLPLGVRDITKMAELTREFLQQLTDRDKADAVEIVNRNLNSAIARMLNFSGDELMELMKDLRRHLRQQGKGLVLLIEDFARLQGIDGALLQALIEAPGSGEDALCELRWAMAVNRGYYGRLAPTVQTRMDMLVDMDRPVRGNTKVLGEDDIVAFAARYLNTVRLGRGELLSWYREAAAGGEQTPAPSACKECNSRETCHEAFGSAGEMGLYPFNKNAILNMARGVDPGMDERFNPRALIKFVLARILDDYPDEVRQGHFPSSSLIDAVGGCRIPAALEQQLASKDPSNYGRQERIVWMWGRRGEGLAELPKLRGELYQAFGVPVPTIKGKAKDDEEDERESEREKERNKKVITPPSDPLLNAIEAWRRGEKMPQTAVGDLRPIVFEALGSYIDWDTPGFQRTAFLTSTPEARWPLFLPRNIFFHEQEVGQPDSVAIPLVLPINKDNREERRLTALALIGLVQYQRNRRWDFDGGQVAAIVVGNCLSMWSQELLKSFRNLPVEPKKWDPVTVSVELLLIGAAMAGRLTGNKRSNRVACVNALFEPWPQPEAIPVENEAWRALYRKIADRRKDLLQVVQGRAFGGKGGQAGTFINTRRILVPVTRTMRSWEVSSSPAPEVLERNDRYRDIAQLQQETKDKLPIIAGAERHRRLKWLDEVHQEFPEDAKVAEAIDAVAAMHDAAVRTGLTCTRALRDEFEQVLAATRGTRVSTAMANAEALRSEESATALLPELAKGQGNAATVTAFIVVSKRLIGQYEAAMANRRSQLANSGGGAMEAIRTEIGDSLKGLVATLGVIGGAQ